MTKENSQLEDAQSPWVPRPGTWERVLGSLPQTPAEERVPPSDSAQNEIDLPPEPPT